MDYGSMTPWEAEWQHLWEKADIRKTLGNILSWQYLSAVSAIASSSSVKRFLDASGSRQSKAVFGTEA